MDASVIATLRSALDEPPSCAPAKTMRATEETKQAANKTRAAFFCVDEVEVDIGEICLEIKRHFFAFASNYLFTFRKFMTSARLSSQNIFVTIFSHTLNARNRLLLRHLNGLFPLHDERLQLRNLRARARFAGGRYLKVAESGWP
jgi:hypothetical protein